MASELPDYVAAAQPVPKANRAAWFLNTAPTYAGIMLWFVFWQDVPAGKALHLESGFAATGGGTLAQGLGFAFLGLILAALICHFLFYLVPGLLGLKTGLPLYIVGTSTYGVTGGFLMPGFLMGLLQFGWLSVNAFFAGVMLVAPFGYGPLSVPHAAVSTVWALAAAFLGLMGIQYVAKVATFLPLIPLVILIILFAHSARGLAGFSAPELAADGATKSHLETERIFEQERVADTQPLSTKHDNLDWVEEGPAVTTTYYRAEWVEKETKQVFKAKEKLGIAGIIALLCTYIVGFFATAGAAGADFGMNSRHEKDVHLGGLIGIAGATIFAGGLAILIAAGAQGVMDSDGPAGVLRCTMLMDSLVGEKTGAVLMYLLAIAAFPPACFSTFIAANSFKTTLPKVNPFISVGCGTAVAIALAVTAVAGNVMEMFSLIGASFGPVCGAMAADYLLAGRKWAGPRAGFNPAGWISWVVGFAVGAADFIPYTRGMVYCPPVAAFVVGFGLYLVLAKLGLQSRTLEMPAAPE